MSTDELITRTRRAIETKQPNLAKLYMRKALEQTEQHRRQFNPYRELRQHLQAFSDGLQGIVKAYLDAYDSVAKLILDSLTIAGIYRDDSQVVEVQTSKRYATGDNPGATISVESI